MSVQTSYQTRFTGISNNSYFDHIFFTCFPCQTIHSVIMHAWCLRQFSGKKKKKKKKKNPEFLVLLL